MSIHNKIKLSIINNQVFFCKEKLECTITDKKLKVLKVLRILGVYITII